MILDIDGILKGQRLRKCSGDARWHYGYYLLLANNYARLELDCEAMAEHFVSFRGSNPSKEEIERDFKEYQDNHLIFVYRFGNRTWAQFDTKRSNTKNYRTASDRRSPHPPEAEYRAWLKEQHPEDWGMYHWNPLPSQEVKEVQPDQEVIKSSEKLKEVVNISEQFSGGVGVGVGGGRGTRLKPSARKARGPQQTDIRFHHFVEILHRYWDRFSKPKIRFELWFDAPGGKQLKNILKRHEAFTVEEFTHCVANRARSPGVKHEEPFYLWGGHILEWVGGPKGNGQVSKDAERNARNKAEIIRGITGHSPSGDAFHSGPAVPERDNGGSDRVLEAESHRSRTVIAGTDT